VAYAFGVETLQMLDDILELECPPGFDVVAVEEGGIPLSDFEHPENALYVTGNSGLRHPGNCIENKVCVSIEIDPPDDDGYTMYGHQALAIVLYDRLRKNNGPFSR
jgi:hypothetical protein